MAATHSPSTSIYSIAHAIKFVILALMHGWVCQSERETIDSGHFMRFTIQKSLAQRVDPDFTLDLQRKGWHLSEKGGWITGHTRVKVLSHEEFVLSELTLSSILMCNDCCHYPLTNAQPALDR